MNPPDLNMIWMGSFASDRSMVIDESPTNIFNQPGMTIMDDLSQQTHSMVIFIYLFLFWIFRKYVLKLY